MTVSNRQTYNNLSFDQYLSLPAKSFSGLRNEGAAISPTPKMRFGTLVDQYLFTPSEYNGEQIDLVKPVVLQLKSILGQAIYTGNPQLSVSADFEHEGLTMRYKGRLDLAVGKLIIDLKVSELDPVKAVQFFRYDWQLTGYKEGYGAEKIILCSINPKTKKVSLLPIHPVYDWWEHQIKRFGVPKKNNYA